jgi:hypothetical protein
MSGESVRSPGFSLSGARKVAITRKQAKAWTTNTFLNPPYPTPLLLQIEN